MENNTSPNIFLSYAWANALIAEQIDNDFKSIGIQFKRDVRDATYRTSIKEFMQQIGKSDFVLMIISDEYLRSLNCMYEVTELLNTHEFEKRILPIIIDNAIQIFNPLNQLAYYDYWKDRKKEAEKFKRKHANEVSLEYVKKCQNINDNLPVFFMKLTNLKISTYNELKNESYQDLLKIISFYNDHFKEESLDVEQVRNKGYVLKSEKSEVNDEDVYDESMEARLRKSRERIKYLLELGKKLRNGPKTEVENNPNNKKKKISLQQAPSSKESQISRFSFLSADEDFEIRGNNSFLHGNVD